MKERPDSNDQKEGFVPENLVDSDISRIHKRPGKLYESEDYPDKIIRIENAAELADKHGNKIEVLDLVEHAKRLYKELEEKYGIVAPVEFFLGKDTNDEQVVYSTVDKIEGQHLEEVDSSDETIAQVGALYASVAKYFLDKYEEGGLYLWDLNNQSQYIFGKKSGDKEDKIYLIDTDIWLNNSRVGMYLVVEWLARHMLGVEKHLNTRFEKAREYIGQFADQELPEEANDFERKTIAKNIAEIKKFLSDKKFGSSQKSAIPAFK